MTPFASALGFDPGHVARPETAQAVADLLGAAGQAGQVVIPWGGGTGQAEGYASPRADVLLDLSGLDRILAHEPGDLTVTVEAGARLADVQATLAAKNQFLPLDPPHVRVGEQGATVGGILAANASGPLRQGYGTPRDWLLGVTIADGEGRLLKSGGTVVKNVTGYDLPKLHVGARGTLGVIVQATFKVAPLPLAVSALLFDVSGDGDLAAFLPAVHFETAPVLSVLTTARGHAFLTLGYANHPEAVADDMEKAQAAARSYGLREGRALPSPGRNIFALNPFSNAAEEANTVFIARAVGKPASSARQHDALVTLAETTLNSGGDASRFGARVDTLPGVGQSDIIIAALDDSGDESDMHSAPDALTRLWAAIGAWGEQTGTPVAVLHAPVALRRGGGAAEDAAESLWRPLPASLGLQRALKNALDPRGVLNVGRYVGGI